MLVAVARTGDAIILTASRAGSVREIDGDIFMYQPLVLLWASFQLLLHRLS